MKHFAFALTLLLPFFSIPVQAGQHSGFGGGPASQRDPNGHGGHGWGENCDDYGQYGYQDDCQRSADRDHKDRDPKKDNDKGGKKK